MAADGYGVPPATPRTGPVLIALTAVALALVAGACGGEDSSAPNPDQAAYADDAADGGDRQATATTEVGIDPTPTTEGSGLPPVTTIPISPPDDVDGIYTGVIGGLDLYTLVTDQVAAPPPPRPGVHPLTGLSGSPIDRPAAVVKIDNGPAAAPHIGLNAADIVIEEEVEGGVTRFAAIFQSQSSIVGPVRSGRTTDLTLVSSLGEPLLLYSGANLVIDGIIRRQPLIQNRSAETSSGYWRDESRSAPSNLFTDTAPHWASAMGGAPAPQFAYRDANESADGFVADTIEVDYAANRAVWHWQRGMWHRSQRGERHELVGGEQVTADNVIVVEADEVDTGLVDASGGTVPEFVFVGTGRAVVFTDGKRIEGSWTRPSMASVATLARPSGEIIELSPGRTWIELVATGSGALR